MRERERVKRLAAEQALQAQAAALQARLAAAAEAAAAQPTLAQEAAAEAAAGVTGAPLAAVQLRFTSAACAARCTGFAGVPDSWFALAAGAERQLRPR